MKIITAIENKKINEQLKTINNIDVQNSDIQYKEGILEYLEKNKNIEAIIMTENLPGQIKIQELINKINIINNKIKIIIINNKKEIKNNNQDKLENKNNKVKYIYLEKIDIKNILKILSIKNKETIKKEKIIKVLGNRGSGKTVFVCIISILLSKIKNKKILIIDEDENKILTKYFLKKIKEQNKSIKEKEIIKINKNIYLLNINYLMNKKINIKKIIKEKNKEFDYIIVDTNNYKYLNNISNNEIKHIFLLESNVLEIKKTKKFLINNDIKIILNKLNINSIDEKIIEETLKKEIIGKINYSKSINLFINNLFDYNYLSKKEIYNFLKIIEKI